MQCAPPYPVDFVFTWVNGSNPEMLHNYTRYVNDTLDLNRFVDIGQLKFSLRGIEMYAPWFNHIYIVTNGERPSWLRNHSKVSVVSHWDIFKDTKALPVFNSNAIEMNIHRIQNLTEQYIYLNDDTTFTGSVCWSDFYTEKGTNIYYMKNWGMINEPKKCEEYCMLKYADNQCNIGKGFGFVIGFEAQNLKSKFMLTCAHGSVPNGTLDF